MEARATRATAEPLPRATVLGLIAMGVAVLIIANDFTALSVALPAIERDLDAELSTVQWVINAYALTFGVLIVTGGRLADMLGRRRTFVAGAAVFAAFSALGGAAQGVVWLLACRALMGIGGALMWPAILGMTYAVTPRSRAGLAGGIILGAAGLGNAVGPLLGGALTDALSWRWIFFVNLPIGAFGALWTMTSLREIGRLSKEKALDLWGVGLFVSGIVLILLALTRVIAGDRGVLVPTLFVAGLAVLVAFVLVERRQVSPMMDFALFRVRVFTFGNASLFINALARGALMFMLTFAFQGVLGASPLQAGVMLLPLSVTILLTGPLSGSLSDRYGSRWLSSGGLMVSAIALYLLAVVPLTGPYLPLALGLILSGLGNGMFNSPNTSAVMGSVPSERRGVAASMRSLVFNGGQLFSIALAFTIVSTTMGASHLSSFMAGANVGVSGAAVTGFQVGLRHAFYLSAALSVVAAVLSYMRGAYTPAAAAVARTPGVEHPSV